MTKLELRKKQITNLISQVNSICLSSGQLRYLGNISYTLKKNIIEKETFSSENGATTQGGFTDGENIFILCSEKNMNRNFLLFMLLHEILHIISRHCYRGKDFDDLEFQIAADHIVNRILVDISEEVTYVKPDFNYIVFFPDLHKKYPNISLEELYYYLIDQRRLELQQYTKFKISSGESLPGECDDENESNEGDSSDDDNESNDSSPSNHKNLSEEVSEQKTLEDCDGDEDKLRSELKKSKQSVNSEYIIARYKDKITGKYQDVVLDTNGPCYTEDKEKIKDLELKSSVLWKAQRNTIRGSLPSGLVEYIDSIVEVKMPWHMILNNAILYKNQNNSDVSWLRKNEIIKIGRCMGDHHGESANTMIVGLDSSASITKTDLQKYFSVIEQSIKKYTKVIVIVHDVVIQDVLVFKNNKKFVNILEQLNTVLGRGGTSHIEVFDKIELLCKKEKVSTIVFLTDFISNIEKIYDNYDFFKRHDPIWVISKCTFYKDVISEKPSKINGEWIIIE